MMHDLKFGRSVGCFKSSTTYRFALHKHQEWKGPTAFWYPGNVGGPFRRPGE
jgi:hypothetical protein